jgi:riboflavin synthase
VNLERSLAWGDRMGGHLVMGHVDVVAAALSVAPKGIAREITFSLPEAVRHFLAAKGSVAVDGVSLTVIEVNDASFTVGLIPHTVAKTTLRSVTRGTEVNLEADVIARYVHRSARESAWGETAARQPTEGLTEELLRDEGFL